MKVIQAFHTVRIVLYIRCSGPVVECLNKINMLQSATDHWARTPDIQNYAYSMKSLDNFQNVPASDFELFSHLSTVILHISLCKHKFKNIRKTFFHPLFQEKITIFGITVAVAYHSTHKNVKQIHSWIYK